MIESGENWGRNQAGREREREKRLEVGKMKNTHISLIMSFDCLVLPVTILSIRLSSSSNSLSPSLTCENLSLEERILLPVPAASWIISQNTWFELLPCPTLLSPQNRVQSLWLSIPYLFLKFWVLITMMRKGCLRTMENVEMFHVNSLESEEELKELQLLSLLLSSLPSFFHLSSFSSFWVILFPCIREKSEWMCLFLLLFILIHFFPFHHHHNIIICVWLLCPFFSSREKEEKKEVKKEEEERRKGRWYKTFNRKWFSFWDNTIDCVYQKETLLFFSFFLSLHLYPHHPLLFHSHKKKKKKRVIREYGVIFPSKALWSWWWNWFHSFPFRISLFFSSFCMESVTFKGFLLVSLHLQPFSLPSRFYLLQFSLPLHSLLSPFIFHSLFLFFSFFFFSFLFTSFDKKVSPCFFLCAFIRSSLFFFSSNHPLLLLNAIFSLHSLSLYNFLYISLFLFSPSLFPHLEPGPRFIVLCNSVTGSWTKCWRREGERERSKNERRRESCLVMMILEQESHHSVHIFFIQAPLPFFPSCKPEVHFLPLYFFLSLALSLFSSFSLSWLSHSSFLPRLFHKKDEGLRTKGVFLSPPVLEFWEGLRRKQNRERRRRRKQEERRNQAKEKRKTFVWVSFEPDLNRRRTKLLVIEKKTGKEERGRIEVRTHSNFFSTYFLLFLIFFCDQNGSFDVVFSFLFHPIRISFVLFVSVKSIKEKKVSKKISLTICCKMKRKKIGENVWFLPNRLKYQICR